ncbi:sensor histidine kinase [Ruania alba]|nr:histidine kinase [Ruania alba]
MSTTTELPARPPWWRTALLVVTCLFFTVSNGVFSEIGSQPEGLAGILLIPLILGIGGLPFLLLWRHRAPFVVTWVAVAGGVVLPLGASTALVALASLIGRRRGPAVWWAAGGVAVTVAVAVARDIVAPTVGASLLKTLGATPGAPPETEFDLDWQVLPILLALTMCLSIGAGLLLRARRLSRTAETAAAAAGQEQDRLGHALARQVERERIAREVHDVLGHRLSLLTLHAGALQANASGDDELAQSAALVRENAGRSMEDLRSLLTVLRHDLDQDPVLDVSLADLPSVIHEVLDSGSPVVSSVYLDQAESADPALARAVYRIVQEVLTNARRHAPGEQVRLSVTGGPDEGVRIDATNRYVASPEPRAGSGIGLQGVAERAELLGGTVAYGLDDGGRTFRVTVALPWRAVS